MTSTGRTSHQIVPVWRGVFAQLGVSNDDFIRTSEPRHIRAVQEFLKVLHDSGDVYLAQLTGVVQKFVKQ